MSKVTDVILSTIIFSFIMSLVVSSLFIGSLFVVSLIYFILSFIVTLVIISSVLFIFAAGIQNLAEQNRTTENDINDFFKDMNKSMEPESKDEKIQELKQEYMNGQMTKEEFDRRMDLILKEEDKKYRLNRSYNLK